MNPSIQQAIVLNNQAVSILSNSNSNSLRQGKFGGYALAISHLSDALSTIKTTISMTDADGSPSLSTLPMSIDDCMDSSVAETFHLHDESQSSFCTGRLLPFQQHLQHHQCCIATILNIAS